ncbi:putative disease resistance protein, partial [Quercus suber]
MCRTFSGRDKFIYNAKNLRTLIVVGHSDYNVSKLLHHFRRLRTLSLSCYYGKLKGISDEIEDLMHLRYLKIHNCHRNELPETIYNLCNLQILNITIGYDSGFKKLPQGINKLINLKHLILDGHWEYLFEFPRGIGRLSSLTKLSHFYVGGKDDSQRCELGELKYLNHLQGTLTINRLGNVWEEWIGIGGQEKEDCIIIMPCLQMLQISYCPNLKSLPDFLFKTSLREFESDSQRTLPKRDRRGLGQDFGLIILQCKETVKKLFDEFPNCDVRCIMTLEFPAMEEGEDWG